MLLRFAARLIYIILIGIVGTIIVVVIIAIAGLTGGGLGGYGSYSGATAVSAVVSAVITVGYFVLMESRVGQTVGKMLLKLRTVGPDGNNPTTQEAFRRNWWTGLGILGVVPFLGFLGSIAELVIVIVIAVTINNSPTRQGWHDKQAGTQVIKTG
ncbi:MAG: RDD family protein [Nocardioidaceae bacterium]|nr:RDD family protein [Nocardioidaceae bacterium]